MQAFEAPLLTIHQFMPHQVALSSWRAIICCGAAGIRPPSRAGENDLLILDCGCCIDFLVVSKQSSAVETNIQNSDGNRLHEGATGVCRQASCARVIAMTKSSITARQGRRLHGWVRWTFALVSSPTMSVCCCASSSSVHCEEEGMMNFDARLDQEAME